MFKCLAFGSQTDTDTLFANKRYALVESVDYLYNFNPNHHYFDQCQLLSEIFICEYWISVYSHQMLDLGSSVIINFFYEKKIMMSNILNQPYYHQLTYLFQFSKSLQKQVGCLTVFYRYLIISYQMKCILCCDVWKLYLPHTSFFLFILFSREKHLSSGVGYCPPGPATTLHSTSFLRSCDVT